MKNLLINAIRCLLIPIGFIAVTVFVVYSFIFLVLWHWDLWHAVGFWNDLRDWVNEHKATYVWWKRSPKKEMYELWTPADVKFWIKTDGDRIEDEADNIIKYIMKNGFEEITNANAEGKKETTIDTIVQKLQRAGLDNEAWGIHNYYYKQRRFDDVPKSVTAYNDWQRWNRIENDYGYSPGSLCRTWILYDTISPVNELMNIYNYIMHNGIKNIIGRHWVYQDQTEFTTEKFVTWSDLERKFYDHGHSELYNDIKNTWYAKES